MMQISHDASSEVGCYKDIMLAQYYPSLAQFAEHVTDKCYYSRVSLMTLFSCGKSTIKSLI